MARTTDPTELLDDIDEEDPQLIRRRTKGRTRQQREQQKARRARAVSFRLAGMTYSQIGEQLQVSEQRARSLVTHSLDRTEQHTADQMREVENQRLDRAQAAIWPRVLRGDDKAVNLFLQISDRRARLNGLNAPTKIDLSMSVKHEMVEALEELETMVLGEIESTPAADQEERSYAPGEQEDVVDAELVEE